jgi:hypothetical protein
MNDSYLHFTASRLQAAEIDRRAQQLGPQLAALSEGAQTPLRDPVTLRFAAPEDHRELKRLADLDSASLPADPLLVGERAGQPIAALSLADGAVVANPFVASADVVAMLRLRALQLRRAQASGRRTRRRRPLSVLRLRLLRDGDL